MNCRGYYSQEGHEGDPMQHSPQLYAFYTKEEGADQSVMDENTHGNLEAKA